MSKKTYEAFQPSVFSYQPDILRVMIFHTSGIQLISASACIWYFSASFLPENSIQGRQNTADEYGNHNERRRYPEHRFVNFKTFVLLLPFSFDE